MLYFTLNNGKTAQWHVGESVPKDLLSDRWEAEEEKESGFYVEPGHLQVVEVFADSDELTHVLARFENLPKLRETTEDNMTTNLIVRNFRGTHWFGDHARFIWANLI